MGQDQSKRMRCGAYQQEPPVQIGGDAALRIRRQLEQGKIKPQQPNSPMQQYQTVPPPSSQPSLSNHPNQQTIPNQKTRKNIEIKPPRDMIRQENQRRGSLNRNKSVDSKPPKPKSARPPVAPAPKPDIQHENIIRLSRQPFPNCVKTDKGFMQNCQMPLAQLIESRYNSEMYFPEQNVISLLESIVYAMAALEVKQIRHHDIYPTNIFFRNGIFKLSNPSLTPQSSYSLTLQRKRFSFLSPELIICLREQAQDVKEDLLFRADVFSFGMILLEFCSLKPSSECYDQDNYDIVDVVIKRRLAEIRQVYNPKIADAIDCLLKYEVQQRMTAFEFSKHLNQHVHQHQMETANAKKSQVTIQPELKSPPLSAQQPQIAPENLPGATTMPHQSRTQTVQGQNPQIVQGENQIQMRQPVSPPVIHQHYLQQQSPSQQQIQSQSNSQLRIIQPGNKPPSQSTPSLQYQPSPHETLMRSNAPPPLTYVPSPAQQQLPSYHYILSPISPINQPLSYQPQRQYFTNPSPSPSSEVELKPYISSANDFLNKYSSTGSSSYNNTTYTNSSYQPQPYSLSHNPPTATHKTLGELEYNIPSYKDDFLKAERDVGYKEMNGGYKSYRDAYNEPSSRDIGGYDRFQDKDWNQIKNDLSNKYGLGSPLSPSLSGSLSSRNEEESLEERVRRILQKSKQIK